MPEGIQIPISSTYTGSGVKEAISDISRLGSVMDMPGMKTAAVNSQVMAQRMDNAAARARLLKTELTALGRATPIERWQAFTTGMNKAVSSSAMGLAKFGAMAVAVGYATKKVYDFGKAGAEMEFTRRKFDRLASSVGDTGNAFLNDLRVATKGTVSDFQLLRQGSDLLQLGLAKDTKEATRLSAVMTALGMDTGELTLALANQSKRRLDQLGLSLSAFNKIESKLRDSGMSKQDAFKEAFMQTAEQTVNITGNRADSTLKPFLQLEAQGANVWNNIKKQVSQMIAPDVQNFANFFQGWNAVQNQDMMWTGNILELMFSDKAPLRKGMASDFSSLWSGGGVDRTTMSSRYNPLGDTGAIAGLSAAQNYTAMAYAARNLGGAGLEEASPEEAEKRNELLLAGALKITQATGKNSQMTQAQQELSLAITEQSAAYDAAYKANGKYYEMIQTGETRVNTLKAALDDLSAKGMENELVYQNMSKEYEKQLGVLNNLEAAYGKESDIVEKEKKKLDDLKNQKKDVEGASISMVGGLALGAIEDPQKQLDFARAMGMITDESYRAQSAILDMGQALESGRLSAQSMANYTKGIGSGLVNLDGERFTAYMDIIVSYIGGGADWQQLNRESGAMVRNCFAADTMILMADGSGKAIQDVMMGDRVLSYDFASKSLIPATVSETYHHTAEEAGEYYLIVNETIHVTPNHPLLINGEWREAGTLKYADILKTPTGEIGVSSVARIYRKIETFNLHIDDENHNYFADGILAHNKAGGGKVLAPGDGTKDTVLVPLANREFVVNAKAAEQFMPLLEAINDGRFMPGMAGGGTVGGRRISRGIGRGRGGGYSTSRSSSSRGAYFSSGMTGLSGSDVSSIVSETTMELAPSLAGAVSDAVNATVAGSPELQAVSQSVETFKEMAETLSMILAKTPSEAGIGRAVNGDMARVA